MEKLFDTTRLAGKAEVATEVLHNVGNILNSISVSSEYIREMTQKSSCLTLPGIVDLIEQHTDNIAEFISSDPKGKLLPAYFAKLSESLGEEQKKLLTETGLLHRHIRLITEIIRKQQDNVKDIFLVEQIDLTAIVEECLDCFRKIIMKNKITIKRNYERLPTMHGERHKIVQIVSNLISNATEAFNKSKQDNKEILLRLYPADQQSVVLEVHDNGMGIEEKNLQKIFVFGFSTKENKHGFGLHNAANLAAEMSGTLTAESGREGNGAIFRLQLPVTR